MSVQQVSVRDARDATGPPRSSAIVVGVLFIVATGFFMVGQGVYASILGDPEVLTLAHPQRVRVLSGILVELVGVLAIPLIALAFYPVLRAYDETVALGYVGTRLLEAVALLVADFASWALVSVSRGYLDAVPAERAGWEVAGATLQSVSEASFLVSVVVMFPISVLMLNSLLWRSRLVPRLLSGWGFGGGVVLLLGGLAGILELGPPVPELVLTGPIAIQEMALAVWLITKGFSLPRPATPREV